MICAYGPCSATGGNGWARDFLAGVLTIPTTPFLNNIGGRYHIQYASTMSCKFSSSSVFTYSPPRLDVFTDMEFANQPAFSFIFVLAVYVIYWNGPTLRKKSRFAQQLSDARADTGGHGYCLTRFLTIPRPRASERSQQELRARASD